MKNKTKLQENPFNKSVMKTFFFKTNSETGMIESKTKMLLDANSGETTEVSLIVKKELVFDNQRFNKVYTPALELMMDLPQEANKLMLFIMTGIERDKDYIILDKQGFLQRFNYKTSMSLYKGIDELLAKGVIALSTITNKYWINPYYFFNGDRTKLIKK